MHKIIFFPKKICVPTLPKIFRPVTRNTLIFYLALSHMRNHHSLKIARIYTNVPMKANAMVRLRMSADPSEHLLLVYAI